MNNSYEPIKNLKNNSLNHLTKSYSKKRNNTKYKNMQNKNKRYMWIRSEKNINKLCKRALRLFWWPGPKEDSESYGRNQALEAKNGTKLHYWISPSTLLQEMKMEFLHNRFSPEEDKKIHAPKGKFELVLIKICGEALFLKGGSFPLQNTSSSGSGSQH